MHVPLHNNTQQIYYPQQQGIEMNHHSVPVVVAQPHYYPVHHHAQHIPAAVVQHRPQQQQQQQSQQQQQQVTQEQAPVMWGTPIHQTQNFLYAPATIDFVQHPILKGLNATIGAINVPLMIDIVSYLAAFTILITYVVAASLGHVKWFPCMITATGTDYPENIFFRIGLISSVFYWFLMLELEYFWLRAQAASLAGLVEVNYSNNIIAYLGFFFFGITIATIDQGHTPTQIHGACAVFFFILLCVYCIRNLATIRNLRKYKPDVVSQTSFNTKVTLLKVWYLVVASIIMYALKFSWGLPVAEWIGTFSIILYLRTSANDLKGFILNINDEKYDLKTQLARNYHATKNASEQQSNAPASAPVLLSFPTQEYNNNNHIHVPISTKIHPNFMSIQRPFFSQPQH